MVSTAVTGNESFIGEWDIKPVEIKDNINPYYLEVKYPKWLNIEEIENKFIGTYKDQYNYECKLPILEIINEGKDIVFIHCGTTKHKTSYIPIHHAKIINGELRGVVTTTNRLFEWVGKRKK